MAVGGMSHLDSAAAALEAVLNAEWPEHTWIVSVGEPERDDAGGLVSSTLSDTDPSPLPDDAHPVKGRAALDDDDFDEAA